ncbi:glutamate-1-semialdehyde 2,1-aminomutase [Natronospora cellulosivora (SeqCode)]
MNREKSEFLYEKSKKYIPAGVNSPVRAFKNLSIDPPFIKKGQGPYIYDQDNNKYIDYVMSWGPLITGHADPEVVSALQNAINNGSSFGAPTDLECEMAELVVKAVPSIEKVRMVNSGTEALMSAIRLARGYTGRNKIIKMTGCYHGHSDSLLVEAGSGLATLSKPNSAGVPLSFAEETITLPYNNIKAVEEAYEKYPEDIAAIVMEPIPANMGVILPEEKYLEQVREITSKYQSLLIFDEVISGFRLAYGGAQELYKVTPDLTCLGKIIGGGLPVGAYGGKKEIMDHIAPDGPVYQAGTLSGNPLAMTAGITILKKLGQQGVYTQLEEKTDYLVNNIKKLISDKNLSIVVNSSTGLFTLFFGIDEKVKNYHNASSADRNLFEKFFIAMLDRGIYLAPSPFEASFLSLAHQKEDLDRTLEVYEEVFDIIK